MFRIGLEDKAEGRTIAWVLGHPGCTVYGLTAEAALAAAPGAIRSYRDWITAHGGPADWLPDGEEVELAETWEVTIIDDQYEPASEGYRVNAWFWHDWKPLTSEEVDRARLLLGWTRQDLLAVIRGLTPETLDTPHPGERWTLRGIVGHVAGAEWWYLDRLGLASPREALPEDVFERLEVVRAHLLETLPDFIGSRQVVGIDGEFWSPRKLLRRAAWHERDHTGHIAGLLERAG